MRYRRYRDYRTLNIIRQGSPAEVEQVFEDLASGSSPSYGSSYQDWVEDRKKWGKELLEQGVIEPDTVSVHDFRGYRYRITVGKRGGLKFKSLGKVI
jgi:methenyltetrahydromethanopterin cyclohydrolase